MVLRAVAGGASRWSEIYERASTKLGPLSKSDLTYLLDRLVRFGYLERSKDGSFSIPDPVVEYMARALKS